MIQKDEDEKVKKILKLCLNEGDNKETGKWTFDYEDLEVQSVSVFAIQQYIKTESKQTFRDWLFVKPWVKIKEEISEIKIGDLGYLLGHTLRAIKIRETSFGDRMKWSCYNANCCTNPMHLEIECSEKDSKNLVTNYKEFKDECSR